MTNLGGNEKRSNGQSSSTLGIMNKSIDTVLGEKGIKSDSLTKEGTTITSTEEKLQVGRSDRRWCNCLIVGDGKPGMKNFGYTWTP